MNWDFNKTRRILIPTDGSDYSIHAAEYGVSIAKMLSIPITVVYVIDEVVIDQFAKGAEQENIEQELRHDGQKYVEYVTELAENTGVKADSVIAKGNPFEQIVELAKKLEIDLIVMGTYGRRGAERILIGSVAQRVIEYSLCPVLVIK